MRKLTEADIEAMVEKEEAMTLGTKTTAVVLTLKNGFEVVGTSACVNPADYNLEVGRVFARQRAIDKVWELEGYVSQVFNMIGNMPVGNGITEPMDNAA